jgi:hypothetical protein
LVTTGTGHYTQNRLLKLLGHRHDGSQWFSEKQSRKWPGRAGWCKERLMAYKENFSENYYLDKIIKQNQK